MGKRIKLGSTNFYHLSETYKFKKYLLSKHKKKLWLVFTKLIILNTDKLTIS